MTGKFLGVLEIFHEKLLSKALKTYATTRTLFQSYNYKHHAKKLYCLLTAGVCILQMLISPSSEREKTETK